MTIPRLYVFTSLAIVFLASSCITALCFIVDPYKLFPSVPGLSPNISIDLFYYLHFHKPYAIENIQPRQLIVGSSRASGLPALPLQKEGDIAYNAALPGTSLREIRQMVEHAQAVQPLSHLYITLDYAMFLKSEQAENNFFNVADRYQKVDPSLLERLRHTYQRIEDYWRSLYSVDALMDSWRILAGISRSSREYHDDGTWDNAHKGANPERLYGVLVNQVYALFTEKDNQLDFDQLTRLLDFASDNEIPVTVLISPMQGLLMQTTYLAGKWEQYFDWQRQLVGLVAARQGVVGLYGVEDKPRMTLEAVNTPQPLYLDGIHYTQRAGNDIMACLAGPCDSDLQPTRLDENSISIYLEQVNALREQYLLEHPEDVDLVQRWLAYYNALKAR